MQQLFPDLIAAASELWQQLEQFARGMMVPWRLNQLLALFVLFIVAHFAAKPLARRFTYWLRTRKGWPKSRLRLGILFQQRLRVVLFAVLAWIAVIIMREVTWPSRSQLIALAAAIATAWAAVGFLVQIIANRTLRRLASWAAWIWVTLYFLGFLEPAAALLDSVAISLGSFRLSALTALKTVAVTAALMVGARAVSSGVSGRLSRNTDISPAMQVLTAKLLQGVLITLALLIGLSATGVDLTGLTIFTGALGVGLGFGLQKVVSNLMSGFIILMDKSIAPGDVISIGDTFGWIDQLGARYVSVVTRDGREYLIPNEDLVTGQVVNWSHTNDFVRLDMAFGTAYSDDPHEVSRLAINAALTVRRVLAQRKPVCWITAFGPRSVEYVLRFWISDPTGGITNVRGQVYLALWDTFKKNGITLPYPQYEVRMLGEDIGPAPSQDVPQPKMPAD